MADDSHRAVEAEATRKATGAARSLSATMPRLILEARRVAATVIHGLHGRRRAGAGENFWQFRCDFHRYRARSASTLIDWPRSARDDQSLCARQVGSRWHTRVDLAGPLEAIDGVRLAAGVRDQARPAR